MSQTISFSKMHGLGNDFVVINCIHQSIHLDRSTICFLADRHLGIGFDQLLLIEKSNKADFACRIFNADGSEAEQCGNGMRCVARFIQEEKLTPQHALSIETKSGIIHANIQDDNTIQVSLGQPCFQPEKIPFIAEKIKHLYSIQCEENHLELAVLSMGNPHAILSVSDVDTYPVKNIGAKLAIHPAFPEGVNLGFMEVIDRQHIRLRTFERGVGETRACGSNACAAVVAGIINDWLDHHVEVQLVGGKLFIQWEGEHQPLLMTGPAQTVFSGTIKI